MDIPEQILATWTDTCLRWLLDVITRRQPPSTPLAARTTTAASTPTTSTPRWRRGRRQRQCQESMAAALVPTLFPTISASEASFSRPHPQQSCPRLPASWAIIRWAGTTITWVLAYPQELIGSWKKCTCTDIGAVSRIFPLFFFFQRSV